MDTPQYEVVMERDGLKVALSPHARKWDWGPDLPLTYDEALVLSGLDEWPEDDALPAIPTSQLRALALVKSVFPGSTIVEGDDEGA